MIREMKDSGIDWVREIPSNWYTQRFKFFRTCANVGVSLDKNYWSDDDSCNVFYTAGEKHIYSSFGDFPLDKYTTEQDLLLSRNGTPYVYYPKVHSQYSDHIIRTNVCPEYCKRFVFYCLQQSILSDTVDSVSIPTWSISIWDKQILTVPPLEEQKSIAAFLDSKCEAIDQAIQKQKDIVIKLSEYKQSTITQAVSKGLNLNVEMKDSGIPWIGKIPKKWEIMRIKDTSWLKGRIGWDGLKASEFIDDGPYLITGTDFCDGYVNWDTCVHITKQRFEEDTLLHIRENDLLITKDGTVGKVAIAKDCPKETSLNSGVMIIRNESKYIYNSKYMYYILLSDEFKHWFEYSQKPGSTIKHLYQHQFGEFKYTFPPLEEQQQIADFLDSKCSKINESIERSNKIIQKLEEYKKALIYNAVTGKIDCRGEVK